MSYYRLFNLFVRFLVFLKTLWIARIRICRLSFQGIYSLDRAYLYFFREKLNKKGGSSAESECQRFRCCSAAWMEVSEGVRSRSSPRTELPPIKPNTQLLVSNPKPLSLNPSLWKCKQIMNQKPCLKLNI